MGDPLLAKSAIDRLTSDAATQLVVDGSRAAGKSGRAE